MASSAAVSSRLTAAFVVDGAGSVEIIDTSGGCGSMFEVVVVSEKFTGVSRIERHRLVNAAVADLGSSIHALSIKAQTPAEVASKSAKGAAAEADDAPK